MPGRENRLIAGVVSGNDPAAFGALVELHQGRLRGYLLRLTRGDAALSDDLAQEVFLQALRQIKNYRGGGSFAGWLNRIAYSKFLMHLRAHQAREKREAAWDGLQEKTALANDLSLDVERAMANLKTEEASALTLCFSQGYTHEEAAQIMDMPLGTLKSHIARGKVKLAKSLAHLKKDYA